MLGDVGAVNKSRPDREGGLVKTTYQLLTTITAIYKPDHLPPLNPHSNWQPLNNLIPGPLDRHSPLLSENLVPPDVVLLQLDLLVHAGITPKSRSVIPVGLQERRRCAGDVPVVVTPRARDEEVRVGPYRAVTPGASPYVIVAELATAGRRRSESFELIVRVSSILYRGFFPLQSPKGNRRGATTPRRGRMPIRCGR